jgi:hypothetical protein
MALTNSECGVCFPQNPKSTFSLTCNALCAQKLWRAYIQIPYCMRKVLVSFFLVALAATLSVTIVAHTVCSIPLRLLTRKLQFAVLFFAHAATMLGALNACTLLIRLDPFSIRKFALRLRFLANTTSLPDDAFFAFTLGDHFLPHSVCEISGGFVLVAHAAHLDLVRNTSVAHSAVSKRLLGKPLAASGASIRCALFLQSLHTRFAKRIFRNCPLLRTKLVSESDAQARTNASCFWSTLVLHGFPIDVLAAH